MSTDITIPEPRTAAVRRNPQTMLIYSNFKVGKTTACAALPDSLLLELRYPGADYVPHGRIMDVPTPERFKEVLAGLTALRKAGKPAVKRLIVDELGTLDEWVFDLALDSFNHSPMASGKLQGLKSITDLPGSGSGGSAGWGWYREELMQVHYKIIAAAEEVIFLSHLRSSVIKKEVGDVEIQDVDLTGGKTRRLFCGQTSAIGFMFRRRVAAEDQLVLTFKGSESLLAGCYCQHLTGKEFVIGRSTNGGPPTFDWSAVFLPETP